MHPEHMIDKNDSKLKREPSLLRRLTQYRWWIACLATLLLLLSLYGLNELSKSRHFQLLGELITQVDTSEKVVALTFDDGPGPNTEAVLDILAAEQVKATFFLTGREIEENWDLARQIVQEGHQIGNHSYSHPRLIFKPLSFIRKEIEQTDQLIAQLGYTGEIPFRPPYGRKLLLLPYYLMEQGRPAILWNIEPESDPEVADDPEEIIRYVDSHIEPGSIILLHVMYKQREASLQAVPGLIRSLKEKGYTFTTVTELLHYER